MRERGADIILLPLIAIAPANDLDALRRAARNCNQYDWLIFTSSNAVSAFLAAMPFAGRDCKPRIAAIGAPTKAAAEEQGFHVALTPQKGFAESLVDAFAHENLQDKRILIPSAAETRDVLAPALRNRGAEVDVVVAYRNVVPPETEKRARSIFCEPYPDWLTFFSPSAVGHLVNLTGSSPLSRSRIASIGPSTSAFLRSCNLTVSVEACEQSAASLVDAMASCKTSP